HSYPLITFSSPYDETSMAELQDNGDHLRAAVLAARQGIPVNQWPSKVLNLTNPQHKLCLLQGRWRDNWDGVWLHKSHGDVGITAIEEYQIVEIENVRYRTNLAKEKIITGASFYDDVAKHIMQ